MTRDEIFADIDDAVNNVLNHIALLSANQRDNSVLDGVIQFVETITNDINTIKEGDLSDNELETFRDKITSQCKDIMNTYDKLLKTIEKYEHNTKLSRKLTGNK